MITVEENTLEERDLPRDIDYYIIDSEGNLQYSTSPDADVYIDEFDVQHLKDKETMLYIREHHGARLGVMHEVAFTVRPKGYKTTKMLLGIIKK